MRLFPTLFRKKMPGGHIYRGKYRLVKPVTKKDLAFFRFDIEREERNMFYLRQAYLTPEQAHGHSLKTDLERYKDFLWKKQKPYYDNVTIESRLAHLRHKECWD